MPFLDTLPHYFSWKEKKMFSRENGGYKMRFPGRSIQTEDMVFGRGWEETRCPQDFMKWQGLHSWKYPSGGQTTLSRKCLKRGEGTVASWKPLLVLRFRPPGSQRPLVSMTRSLCHTPSGAPSLLLEGHPLCLHHCPSPTSPGPPGDLRCQREGLCLVFVCPLPTPELRTARTLPKR